MSAEHTTRRDFMKTTALATAAVAASSTRTDAASDVDRRNERPDRMKYNILGRTNFNCSALTFGCGAALMGGRATRLLERAYEQGVNHFDVGTTVYYKGSEKELAGFLKKHGDDVWVTSKAFARSSMGLGDDLTYTVDTAKEDAKYWTSLLEGSLSDLEQEHVDAYYLMGIGNPEAVKSDELHSAFLKAKDAGKVDHFGISTHKRASACLKAAIECGWHSLAMIAITPGGWYDWDSKALLEGTASMNDIRAELSSASKAGIGLVGMKAGRFIAPAGALGKGDETAFDQYYTKEYLKAPLTSFQRSYAFVLENGMDTVNADMQTFKHFEENLIAARDSGKYFA
ncbi:MAG TPA: aldo/keto reductase [Candidatus Hydrogenedentes bacterium]|nr:aldo/keto reductase [Candidatus Hydrogenedentota bacterium]